MFYLDEMMGNQSFELECYDEREEAEHNMIEMAGNDMTNEWGSVILADDRMYQEKLTEALTYYAIREDL